MNRRELVRGGVALTALGGSGMSPLLSIGRAGAADTTLIRLGETQAQDNPEVVAENFFGKRLSELTNGAYSVKVFPNSVLGSQTAMNEQLRTGALQMAKLSTGFLSGFDKKFAIFSLPYAFSAPEKLYAAEDGDLGKAYAAAVENFGIKIVGWFDAGTRNVYNSVGPVNTPDDIKKLGLRIRVLPDPVLLETFSVLGAEPVPLEANQIFSSLQQGLINAAENSVQFYLGQHHNEVARYFSWTQHLYSVDPLGVSLQWFKAQPSAVQDAILQAGAEATKQQRTLWNGSTQTAIDGATKQGVKFNTPDLAAFQAAVKPVWDKFGPQFGEFYDLFQKYIG